MSEIPSSYFMRRLYTGLKFFLFAPILFFLIAMFFTAAGGFSEALIYLLPLLILAAAIYLFSTANSFIEATTDDVTSFVNKIKTGSIFWIAAGVFSFIIVVSKSTNTALLAFTSLLSLTGFGFLGNGYGILASQVGIRGAQLTARGCYTYIGSTLLITMLYYFLKTITPPTGSGWYGPSAEEIQAYQSKIAILSLLLVLAFLCTIGSLCAVLFGSRFMVDSVELAEQADDNE